MKLRLVDERDDFLELEVTGEDESLLDSLSEYVRSVGGVLYAGRRIDHPLTGKISLMVKTEPRIVKARTAVSEALKRLHKDLDDMYTEVQQL